MLRGSCTGFRVKSSFIRVKVKSWVKGSVDNVDGEVESILENNLRDYQRRLEFNKNRDWSRGA